MVVRNCPGRRANGRRHDRQTEICGGRSEQRPQPPTDARHKIDCGRQSSEFGRQGRQPQCTTEQPQPGSDQIGGQRECVRDGWVKIRELGNALRPGGPTRSAFDHPDHLGQGGTGLVKPDHNTSEDTVVGCPFRRGRCSGSPPPGTSPHRPLRSRSRRCGHIRRGPMHVGARCVRSRIGAVPSLTSDGAFTVEQPHPRRVGSGLPPRPRHRPRPPLATPTRQPPPTQSNRRSKPNVPQAEDSPALPELPSASGR